MKYTIIIFALVLNSCAFASEPLTIKGFRPGLTFDQFRAKVPNIKCDGYGESKRCSYFPKLERENIADLQVIAGVIADAWTFEFVNGRLGQIIVYFDHSNFDDVVASIVAKAGKPAQASQDTLQNRMGARFRSRLYVWPAKDAVFMAQEHGMELDTSFIVLYAKSFEADRKRRARDAAKQDSKDF